MSGNGSEETLLSIGRAHRRLANASRVLETARSRHNLSAAYVDFQAAQKAKKEAQAALDRLMRDTFQMAQMDMGEVLGEVARQVNEGHVLDMPGVEVSARVGGTEE